jgi:serine/threonine protein kinase
MMLEEAQIHRKLDHPLIAHYFGRDEDSESPCIFMEYVGGTSMLEFVNSCGGISEDQARGYIIELLSAIRYLHKGVGICHRDIKLENVMLDNEHIHLIDFGLSKSVGMLATQCGSMGYAAPELILNQAYSDKVDMWSLGVCLYAMISGRLPFESQSAPDLARKIIYSDPPDLPQISADCRDFMNGLLKKSPEERLSITEAMQHSFVMNSKNSWMLRPNALSGPMYKVFNELELDKEALNNLRAWGYSEFELEEISPDSETQASMLYRMLRSKAIKELICKSCDPSVRAFLTAAARRSYSDTFWLTNEDQKLSPTSDITEKARFRAGTERARVGSMVAKTVIIDSSFGRVKDRSPPKGTCSMFRVRKRNSIAPSPLILGDD